ncbi:LAMI_0A06964g1_1 [Lachancea mirantina]|uniref:LAMI_0A06964g1_1 n=1 Tax=Lachancea mirantina TaxID=1230905 RepID=A0A1G4IQY3_9SACH|nr:LAMI_0A06964g1_1 [Lachancea mirantina]
MEFDQTLKDSSQELADLQKNSLVQLVNEDLKFLKLKNELAKYEFRSKEYLRALVGAMPLTMHVPYRRYLKSQAVAIKGMEAKPGYSAVFRNSFSPDFLVSCVDSSLATGFDLFNLAVECYPDNDCLGERVLDEVTGEWSDHYVFESYRQIQARSRNLGSGIMTVVNLKRHATLNTGGFIVSLLSVNRKEWLIADLACQCYALTNTALYETLGAKTSEYILNFTESPVLVLSRSNLYKILSLLPSLPSLNTLICMDDISTQELHELNNTLLPVKRNAKGENISVLTFKQVERIGAASNLALIPPRPSSVYTISFTSGTTGVPKGVEVLHSHLAAGVTFALTSFRIPTYKKGKQLHDMCFLPLAHIFERMIASYGLSIGTGFGFLHKADPAVLVEDLKVLKPDILCLVPRVMTKFEAGIKNSLHAETMSNLAKNVANNILEKKQERFSAHGGPDHSILNNVVFHKVLIDRIRENLGLENADFFVMGSAPISKDTLLFMKSALDMGMRQGYGLTETFAGVTLSEPHERDAGSCGGMGVTTECRLRSVPEMNYDAEHDLKGELQLRGYQVFERYYKDKEQTKKAFDREGWFCTGDIASIDTKGRISIIDRVKNFFKLAQGEYIAPEKIENLYLSSCPYLTQIFVHGDSLKTFLVAVIGLDLDILGPVLHRRIPALHGTHGVQLVHVLNSNKEFRKELIIIINRFAKNLQGFEKIHNIYIEIEPLKVADDTITPTLKVKRVNAFKRFRKSIDRMYEEGSLIKSEKL